MQSLLRWSIEHSTPSDGSSTTPAPQPRADLDPAIIDHILGRPDAELMKENLAVARDETRELDDRLQALDNFEMLIESIDNANDLEKLKMWEPLHTLLTSSTSEDEIKRLVLWILGTAVQNNPSAQTSYLKLNPIPALLAFLQPSPSPTSPKTRAKAVYALSSLLKHNASAVRQLSSTPGGWAVLKAALGDSDIGVRRKVAFLIGSLLMRGSEQEQQEQEQEQEQEAAGRHERQAEATSTALGPPSTTSASTSTALIRSTNTSITSPPSNLHTPNSSSDSAPVYPNSHASMLASPSFFGTSALTRKALEENGMLEALVESVLCPVPFGQDGEFGVGEEGDEEFEGKVVGILNTYLVSLQAPLPPSSFSELQTKLAKFVRQRLDHAGGDPAVLAEKWGLGTEDVGALGKVLGV